MSCVPTSPFIFKFIITFSPSLVLTKRLHTFYKLALYIKLAALYLILDYLSFKFAVAIYGGLPTKQPLPYILYIPCNPYIPYMPYVFI